MENLEKVQKAATGPLDVTRAKRLPTRARPKPEPRLGQTSNPRKSDNMQREDRLAMLYIMGATLLIAAIGLFIA